MIILTTHIRRQLACQEGGAALCGRVTWTFLPSFGAQPVEMTSQPASNKHGRQGLAPEQATSVKPA